MKKGTYQGSKLKKSRTHGFFARKGTKVLKSRRAKGRKEIIK